MQTNTLFVVGAGASQEAGFPVARGLAETVATKLDIRFSPSGTLASSDAKIVDVIQQYAKTKNEMLEWINAAKLINGGVLYSSSIDSFLDAHGSNQHVPFLGKLAIGAAVLEAEGQSSLYVDHTRSNTDFARLGDVSQTWFVNLFRGLTDGVRKSELKRIFEKISFIVFNYDRCIEHFLFNALQKLYGVSVDDAAALMSTLRIYHPWGGIAPLEWQDRTNGIPFGFPTNRANLMAMANNIKTYTERITEGSLINAIRGEVRDASTIVFLGFSYHRENMNLLKPGEKCNASKIFGTAFEVSQSNRNFAISDVARMLTNGGPLDAVVTIEDSKCAPFIQQFSRSLFA